jgi:hypothetical protein
MYLGDVRLGDTLDFYFTTRRFTTGAPFALASGVISAYVGNSVTQITAGITLDVDFDGVTGLNHVRVVASSGNGYAAATNVTLVITTGTVDSVSVVGEVVGSFSIEARALASAERTAIADALLTRDWTSVTGEAARSVLNALRFLRNKWTLPGGTLSVKEEDDTTEAWAGAATTDAAAVPIVGVDPS